MLKAKFSHSILTIALLAFVGCGAGHKGTQEKVVLNQSISAGGSVLNDTEVATALRICYAFRSKKTQFRATKLNTDFKYSTSFKDCDERLFSPTAVITTTLKQLLESEPMVYDSSSDLPYLKVVQTHMDGAIEGICDQVLKGETPLNVQEVSPTEIIQYAFKSSLANGDSYEVMHAKRESTTVNEFIVDKVEKFKVLTNATVAGDLLGLVSEYESHENCEDEDFVKTFIQDYQP
ncbi:hypothetical protein OAT67_02735 [Bacteriovoracaceae bacterium]|nr:hypothetical protein [Bacteriovoracaceae bacterium]